MQVQELYDVEVENQAPDYNAEAVKILEELGLTAQLDLYKKNDETKQHEPSFPFTIASNEQLFVYKSHFPKTVPLEEYNELMPFRVLEILKLAKESNKFTFFQVWTTGSGSYRNDPVLVGVITEGEGWSTVAKFYLLACWGDALESYAVLKQKAVDKFKLREMDKIAESILELTQYKAKLEKGMIPDGAYSHSSKNLQFSASVYTNIPELK